ncbi:hypothetical protein, partial [Aerococcus urinaeequi]|uniref:hypothetical protein n=1 Tax=Aerococcus urinaeequi TaxID=51665 RepID=UPI001C404E39
IDAWLKYFIYLPVYLTGGSSKLMTSYLHLFKLLFTVVSNVNIATIVSLLPDKTGKYPFFKFKKTLLD